MEGVREHLHATSDTHQGLTTGQVSDVNEGVVVRGVDVSDGEHHLSLLQLCMHRHSERKGFTTELGERGIRGITAGEDVRMHLLGEGGAGRSRGFSIGGFGFGGFLGLGTGRS